MKYPPPDQKLDMRCLLATGEVMAAPRSAKRVGKKASAKRQALQKKIPATKTAMTKSAILGKIAGNTGLTKKQVSSVFDELIPP